MLLDPAAIGDSTHRFTITEFAPSPDLRHVALHLASDGGEIGRFRVLDIQLRRRRASASSFGDAASNPFASSAERDGPSDTGS
jgi:hypothetical protein